MASLFARISDVLSANISDLIDRVEDPEKMIKQIIREMEENIGRAKEGVVDAIASEKTLQQNVDRHRREAKTWQENARTALKDGKEDLAHQALVRKNEHDTILKSLEPALESAQGTSASLKAQIKALEAKLDEAKRKRGALVARQRAAEAMHSMTRLDARLAEGLDAGAKFGRMEEKVAEMEAHTQAVTEVYSDADTIEQEFLDIKVQTEVDAEMAALKRELDEYRA
jgi:phage shock protein A